MKKHILILFALALYASIGTAQTDILGKWKTIDDETGKEKSIVELFMKGDKLYGKIIQLFREPDEEPDPLCKECTDDRKDQRVIGMEIVRDMESDDDEWEDGSICDPKNGKVYDCKMWLEDGNLKVRGYVAFFYRTQTWLPAN